jgi:CheY-like chemotaxis protein
MPEMDGITAAKIIREIRPAIPIIAQTAYAFHDELDKVHFSSFDDYLFKPIRPMLLISKIKKFLAHATHA